MERKSHLATFLSGIYLLAACLLLVGVLTHCYPEIGGRIKTAVTGLEQSPVRQAFGILADGLEAGEPFKETVSQSVQILFADAD